MKTSDRLATIAIGVLGLTTAPGAFAYLDPGTGSFVLQMIIAGALGAMFYIKTAWAGTRAYLSRLFGNKVDAEPMDESDIQKSSASESE